jgi:hypothetical protein
LIFTRLNGLKNPFMMDTVKVFYCDFIPFGLRAMTVPPVGIYIRQDYYGDNVLLYHELTHWDQYQRMGLINFYAKYFSGLIYPGYWNCPMETEARAAANNFFNR